ncbi:MAG TPA: hypothetical protein GXZ90_05230 [Clostridiales bacterium]|nr:hypothetical protein [Clostridiales bacterium]
MRILNLINDIARAVFMLVLVIDMVIVIRCLIINKRRENKVDSSDGR